MDLEGFRARAGIKERRNNKSRNSLFIFFNFSISPIPVRIQDKEIFDFSFFLDAESIPLNFLKAALLQRKLSFVLTP
jgi:hypothetical protein